ncbi:MAG: DNA mismatch repair protein MutS, partial [Pseudomonadota bacterium]|nr:DNA mismatch repair protein MutS [Pseudomonadota bacterium]
ELEARYRSESGVDNLKIKHNNVLGYFIEVTSRHADKMGGPFIHRQTMTNAMRFTTTELGELARSISEAADKALAVELELFATLVQEVVAQAGEIAVAAAAMARLELATAFALLAVERRYTRPRIDRSLTFQIEGGRHPVVADALAAAAEGDFVANDCDLTDEQRLWILTGPNMAGKSTFLRQNALIVILAQMGSYVPAERAHIGVVDRLFSRVGAADDLARGRSTFMVEMVETAAILNQATERSLVILDEIGRGTATFDGLSIAWATVEHLHETNQSRALFATHYHELVALTAQLDACKPYTMRVKEWQGDVVFLHEVAAGAADRSYGIHVARLAGLPSPAIVRAEQVLETLEQGEQSGAIARLAEDLPLFASAAEPPTHNAPKPSCVEAELRDLNPDDLTPLAALEALYRLRGLLED